MEQLQSQVTSLLPTNAIPSDAPEMPTAQLPDKAKIEKYINAVAHKAEEVNPKLASCLTAAAPVITLPIQLVTCIAPFYYWAYSWAFYIYERLPKQMTICLFGLALCFFGGTYVASIAAIEAFRQMGYAKTLEELMFVKGEVSNFVKENEDDERQLLKDKDGDGVPDGEQMTPQQIASHKAFVIIKAIKQPDKLQQAVGSLWTAYIAVLATLKLEFARTTAFALGIVEVIKVRISAAGQQLSSSTAATHSPPYPSLHTQVPCVRVLSPLVVTALSSAPPSMKLEPDATLKWAVTIIESVLTTLAVIFAWYLQMIVSAFYSGLRGAQHHTDTQRTFLLFDRASHSSRSSLCAHRRQDVRRRSLPDAHRLQGRPIRPLRPRCHEERRVRPGEHLPRRGHRLWRRGVWLLLPVLRGLHATLPDEYHLPAAHVY